MSATRNVPDDVWFAIDPRAGRLSRREWRCVAAFVAALVLAGALAVAGFVRGVVNPRIDGVATTWRFYPATHDVRMRVSFRAEAAASIHVTAIRVDGPGDLEVVAPGPAAFTVPGHGSRSVWIDVHVGDCAAVSRADAMRVRPVIDQFWGHLTTSSDWEQGGSEHGPQFTWQACH